MNTLQGADLFQLHWLQPSRLARHFELHSQTGLVAELRFATAAAASGTVTMAGLVTKSMTFEGVGLFKRRVVLREPKAKDDLAVFRCHLWGDGWVKFSEGNTFHWKSTNWRRTEWGFLSAKEELLFVVKPKPSYSLQMQSVVEVGGQWRDLDVLPWLLMLGWYLRVQDLYAGW
jgi:hypothetical protein